MCWSFFASCAGSMVCSAFSNAFSQATPFVGHLLIFFLMCLFSMLMKFVIKSEWHLPYMDLSAGDYCGDACAGNSAVFRTSFCLTIFYAIHCLFLLAPGCKSF